MRLEGKIAIIVGAGQSPGEGMGNGRATTLRFAQEGARILAVDRLIAAAEETAAMAAKEGGECVPFAADVTKEETLAAAVEAARARCGRIDILHNNVGVSIAGGDKPLDELTEEAFDHVCAINLRGTIMACKHVLPIMRLQRSGAIINISMDARPNPQGSRLLRRYVEIADSLREIAARADSSRVGRRVRISFAPAGSLSQR